jgi:Nucleotidyl transferase AbiEii toxin, Type IV TA system
MLRNCAALLAMMQYEMLLTTHLSGSFLPDRYHFGAPDFELTMFQIYRDEDLGKTKMQDFKTHILPAAQLTLWNRMNDLPSAFTLYGGTAVALRLGHRESVDFDFFSEERLDEARKRALLMTLPWLAGAEILQNRDQTLTVSIDVESNPVKVSFFGGMSIGRVGEPDKCLTNGVCIAALSDLLACKLKCLHDRAEG